MNGWDVGITGLGHRVPDQIRKNDDPIFDWLKANVPDWDKLFTGFVERRILAKGENVIDILEPAARMALEDAELTPEQVDLLIGDISPATFVTPDDLFALKHRLGLSDATLTIPVRNAFSNFNVSVVLADALIRAGRARNILVAVGTGWSRAVNYRTQESISAGDGAAAVVVSLVEPPHSPRWTVVDQQVITREVNFGEMAFRADLRGRIEPSGPGDDSTPDPLSFNFTGPYFHITDAGLKNFTGFGAETAPLAVQQVLARQNIASSDVTLIGHQASMRLFSVWEQIIKPAGVFQTVGLLANMTAASIPVNFALLQGQVATPYLAALSLAPDMHAHTLLLRRET